MAILPEPLPAAEEVVVQEFSCLVYAMMVVSVGDLLISLALSLKEREYGVWC